MYKGSPIPTTTHTRCFHLQKSGCAACSPAAISFFFSKQCCPNCGWLSNGRTAPGGRRSLANFDNLSRCFVHSLHKVLEAIEEIIH